MSGRQQALLQALLPRVAVPHDPAALQQPGALFAPAASQVWLEIGFGGGEHLVWQAEHNPNVGLIGCEPFEDGIVKVLSAIEADRLTNIRLFADDARPLLRLLPDACVARVFVLFPDPWPKVRHRKRRLVSPETVAELARIMRVGGELRMATDIADYACGMLFAMSGCNRFRWLAQSPQDWGQRPADWPQTRYEAKAIAAGRRCYYFRFQRISV